MTEVTKILSASRTKYDWLNYPPLRCKLVLSIDEHTNCYVELVKLRKYWNTGGNS